MKILKKEPQLTKLFTVIILLLMIGTLSYISLAKENNAKKDAQPEEPIRVLMKTKNGDVLFDHKIHTVKSGYGLSCIDCHHHTNDEEEAFTYSCNDCHMQTEKDAPINPTCLDCHEEEEVEGAEINRQVDNSHLRGECIKCHAEYGKGPMNSKEDCKKCHM